MPALIEEVLAGGEVVIARAGKPLARLIPYKESKVRRQPGRWKGRLWMADDLDTTPEEVISAFERGA